MKRILITGLFVGLVLGAAAYATLPRWLSANAAQASGGERTMQIAVAKVENINGEEQSASGVVDVQQVNPPELPATAADAHGLYLGRSGDTLSLGLGNIAVEVERTVINDEEPTDTVNASHSGGTLDINVTPGATVYLETTPRPEPSLAEIEAGEMFMQRTVEVASLADLADNMVVEAWGDEVDGVLNAHTLVLTPLGD